MSTAAQKVCAGLEVLESVGHPLGKAIAGLINMFNPVMLIIGACLLARSRALGLF